jgi:SHS2 domain-containing protein
MEATYRFAERGGEVELEFDAATEAGVFAAALAAFAEFVATDERGAVEGREVKLEGDYRTLLLVDWLNDLVYLAEVEQFVPERPERFELTGDRLRATVVGHRGHPRPLVKAVTLDNLRFANEGGTWHGRVVLDV